MKFSMKTLKILMYLVAIGAVPANAALSPSIIDDTPSSMAVIWEWDGASLEFSEPSFSNWYTDVALTIDLSKGPSGFIGNLAINDPTNPFELLVPLLILGEEYSLGVLADYEFTHLGVSYDFLFKRDIDPLYSDIQLSATVVPLPSAFFPFLSALPFLWAKSSRKLIIQDT